MSGLVWLLAASFAIYGSKQTSLVFFFVAGMFIYPGGTLVDKLFKRRGRHLKGNPLGNLAMESTVILFIGLFLVYSVFQTMPNWLFPIMLMIIGVRYLLFQSIYGLKIYWVLGLILIVSGFIGLNSNQPFYTFGIVGGVLELIFSILIFRIDRNTDT